MVVWGGGTSEFADNPVESLHKSREIRVKIDSWSFRIKVNVRRTLYNYVDSKGFLSFSTTETSKASTFVQFEEKMPSHDFITTINHKFTWRTFFTYINLIVNKLTNVQTLFS